MSEAHRQIWLLNLCLLGLGNTVNGGGLWWVAIGGVIQITTWAQGRFAFWLFVYFAFCICGILTVEIKKAPEKEQERLRLLAEEMGVQTQNFLQTDLEDLPSLAKSRIRNAVSARRYLQDEDAPSAKNSPQEILEEYRQHYKQKIASQTQGVSHEQFASFHPPERPEMPETVEVLKEGITVSYDAFQPAQSPEVIVTQMEVPAYVMTPIAVTPPAVLQAQPVPDEQHCQRCGADRSHGFSFCTSCGHSFGLW